MPVSNSLYFVTLFTPLKICDSNPTVIISKCLLFFQSQPLNRPDYSYMWLISCCCHNCPINNFNFIYFSLCLSKVSGNLNQNLNARMDNFFPVLYQMNRTTGGYVPVSFYIALFYLPVWVACMQQDAQFGSTAIITPNIVNGEVPGRVIYGHGAN